MLQPWRSWGREERLARGQANCTMQYDLCYNGGWTMYRGSPGEGAPKSAWEDESRQRGRDQGTSHVAQT